MAEQLQSGGRESRFDNLLVYLAAVVTLLIAGGAVCAYLILTGPRPSGEIEEDTGRQVRVFDAEKGSHRIAITAYGTTRTSEDWKAIAEVRGRVVQLSSRFEPGEILPAGALLVRIDPTDYQLAVTRLQAELRAAKERLDELDQNEINLKKIETLQRRQLALALAEYERQKKLHAREAASLSVLQEADSAYVTGLTAVQRTSNELALLPGKRDLLKASLDVAETHLARAERDLGKCEIRLPLPARCASKSIEVDQYVAAGERLGTFLSLKAAEVVAMIETRKMPMMFPEGIKELGTLNLAEMSHEESLWKRVKVPVEVRWGLGDRRSVWWGRLARIGSSLDPDTRTAAVIIEVPRPYQNVQPGIRPPLIPGVFCEVTAYGATVSDVVVIPRDALHDNRVYLLREGALHIQPVTVLVLEEERAVISEGIETGEQVILTDVIPASEGMRLQGEVEKNPVQPRNKVDFPADLFEEAA